MTDPDNTPKRRWLKFRLRSLLIFVAVTAAALGKQLREQLRGEQRGEQLRGVRPVFSVSDSWRRR